MTLVSQCIRKVLSVPELRGVAVKSGSLTLPPTTITFLAFPEAENPNCRQ